MAQRSSRNILLLNPLHNDSARPAERGVCPGANGWVRRGGVLAFYLVKTVGGFYPPDKAASNAVLERVQVRRVYSPKAVHHRLVDCSLRS